MQGVLQQVTSAQRQDMVLRCDELPPLPVPAEALEVIFTSLLQLILSKKGEVSPLFLHISCSDFQEAEAECATHRIQFQTNLSRIDDLQAHSQLMAGIGSLLKQYNSSLAFSQRKAQGCIFILSLPR
jgi:hypothetical protein